MKKLILHIGFPKTASTTLQEGLFLPLHNMGKINFLGRTVTSSHKKMFSKGFGQDWVVDFKRYFIMGKKLPRKNYVLSDTLLNVISDEDLTLPAIFNEIQFGLHKDPLTFIYNLKELLTDADEIVILMTIRNQSELIPSCYIQKFGFTYLHNPHFSFEKFVLGANRTINAATFRAFNFCGIAEKYEEVFKAKVVPLFFEDLKNDKQFFFEELGSVLQVDGKDLLQVVGDAHFRKRKAQSLDVPQAVLFPNPIGKFVSNLFGQDPSRPFFSAHWYLKKNFYISFISKLLLSRMNVPAPKIDNETIVFIKDSFSDSNRLFCEKYGLDIKKFRKYNYL